MAINAQDRVRFYLKKVGRATVWSEGVFILLLLLTGIIIVPAIDASLPPEPPSISMFHIGRAVGFMFISIAVSLFGACFVSGIFFSNTRKYPTLLGWPISLHGVLSGFIIGGLIPALILTLLSGRIHNLGLMGLGIPGAMAGFLGSAVGSGYHWLVFRRRK